MPYCCLGCQRAAWASHKLACADLGKNDEMARAEYAACKAGGGGSQKANVKAQDDWYMSIPGLSDKVVCLAWQHRGEFPVIHVATSPDGIDARASKLTVEPRSVWRTDPNARTIDKDFVDPDGQYFISFEVHHPGAENWPKRVQGCFYDNPDPSTISTAEFMDGLVRLQATRVRLVGLRWASHLNGQEGFLRCVDPANSE